jgi:LysM repeat protein
MTKPSAPPPPGPRLCPTCGTRVGAAATKCLVCGADLSVGGARGGRLAAHGRSLAAPMSRSGLLLIALVGVLAVAGIGLVMAGASIDLPAVFERNTPTPSATATLPPTFTHTATATETPVPTPTPLPPVEYRVVAGDTCISIAFNFKVSVQSIIELNRLDPNCILSIGAVLQVPQPTYTPTPLPTATLPANFNTPLPRATYTIHAGDTCLGIANVYRISVADLMEVNGITDCTAIREGQVLIIPLERAVTPGPTPTATLPPPYPAPNLLLPANGQAFTAGDTTVTLQWTSVGELRAGEAYFVTVEDVTCNCARFYRQPTTETRLIIPASFRPTDATPHLFRWNVGTVRQRNVGEGGQPVFDPAGATSPDWGFIWVGAAATPAP